MMSKKIFDLLNIVAKTCRNNIKPFGNMQVVFLGDFYKLPPVSKSDDEDNNKFCFESDNWFDVFPKQNHILLTKIFRQDDIEYKDILMNIRKGIFDEKTKEFPPNDPEEDATGPFLRVRVAGAGVIALVSTKKDTVARAACPGRGV